MPIPINLEFRILHVISTDSYLPQQRQIGYHWIAMRAFPTKAEALAEMRTWTKREVPIIDIADEDSPEYLPPYQSATAPVAPEGQP